MENKVDITGTMIKANPDWQRRVELLAKPELWTVTCEPAPELWKELTPDERQRLIIKMEMVQRAATYLLAGMTKGTVKYETDSYSLEQWMASVMGEGADWFNYLNLMFHAYNLQKQAVRKV